MTGGETNMADTSIATVANGAFEKNPNKLSNRISSVKLFIYIKNRDQPVDETVMDDAKTRRRERRRRKVEMKMEENDPAKELEKTIDSDEFSIKSHVTQSLGKLVRRDTYTVLHSKIAMETGGGDNYDSSRNDSTESKNFTYSLEKNQETSDGHTYNVNETNGEDKVQPVPAPRKRKSQHLEPERVSSDTDRDITEIDLDDLRLKSPLSDLRSNLQNSDRSPKPVVDSDSTKSEIIMAPIPKPRTSKSFRKLDSNIEHPKNEILESSNESLNSKSDNLEEKSAQSVPKENNVTEHSEEQPKSNQLPLLADLPSETKSEEVKQKSKRQKKLIGELFELKGKRNKSKTFSSLMKLEKKKIPKISSILKDLKEEENKDYKVEVEDKVDFQIDSPHYTESAESGQIYVQSKNGFRVMERDEILKNGNDKMKNGGSGGMLEDSTVKTAILFQKFWSRSMIYFHGVLAGFGFSHAATVTAIMLHYNYEPQGFIGVYSCLSLKIHYVFYTLTALCIVSCFDRVDIGHMNRKHWQTAWKIPSMWMILCIYIVSFVLTFSNHITEARFDVHPTANETILWNTESQNDIQVSLLQWYHTIWARDVLVLFAWLMISLTKFSDFLHTHISNMAKYTETKEAGGSHHHIAGPKGDYS